jgi:CheY-like chemotaxis protein
MHCKRILLVDDEPDAIEFLLDLLEDNGYSVITANTAMEGLEQIRAQRPDLVCLDVLMPEESGISLYQKLRTDPVLHRIPVLISSGLSFNRELRLTDYLTLPDGSTIPEPDGVVEKPVDIRQFLATVRRLLP